MGVSSSLLKVSNAVNPLYQAGKAVSNAINPPKKQPISKTTPGNNANSTVATSTSATPNIMGLKAAAPAATPKPSPALPKAQQAAPQSSPASGSYQAPQAPKSNVDTNYQLRPNESITDYNIRINNYNPSSSGGSAPGSTGSAPSSPGKTAAAPPAPMYDPKSGGLYGKLITDLATRSSQPSQAYQEATDYARKTNDALLKSRTNQAEGVNAQFLDGIPLRFAQGRAQVLQNQYLQQQAALGSAYQGATNLMGAANTQQGLQQTGLQAAAGLAAPQQVSYSNQYINPLTGQSVGGGAGVGGTLQSAVATIAEKIQNGTLGYDSGLSQLAAYGPAGMQALNQVLGPNFDTVGSNARAQASAASTLQTGTIGGQLTKAADSANQALDKLQSDFNALPGIQTGGIPFTNSIANSIAGLFGQEALSAYQSTLADARAQLQGVLTASGAVSPTGAEQMALTYLPDDMTPQQFASKLAAAKALVAQKVSAFTQSSPISGGGGGDASFDW